MDDLDEPERFLQYKVRVQLGVVRADAGRADCLELSVQADRAVGRWNCGEDVDMQAVFGRHILAAVQTNDRCGFLRQAHGDVRCETECSRTAASMTRDLLCAFACADASVTVQVWDIGGQSLGSKMVRSYLSGAHVGDVD